MSRDLPFFLEDVLDAIDYIQGTTTDISLETLNTNRTIRDALIKNLEVIGEAMTHVPREVRDRYPEVPWREVIGFRNILVHGYFGVSIRVVWDIIHQDLPGLKLQIERIRADFG